jgi:hypothetical protein
MVYLPFGGPSIALHAFLTASAFTLHPFTHVSSRFTGARVIPFFTQIDTKMPIISFDLAAETASSLLSLV